MKVKMKTKIFLLWAVLIFAFTVTSCKDDSNEPKQPIEVDGIGTFLTKLKSLNVVFQEDFSGWLNIKIDEIETIHSDDILIVKVRIFKGKWKEQTVYFINNNLQSCVLCEVYYEDGENIIFNDKIINDFCLTSEKWELIYEFGEGPW